MLPPFCKLKYARYKIKFQKKIKFRSYLPTQTFLATLLETDFFFLALEHAPREARKACANENCALKRTFLEQK